MPRPTRRTFCLNAAATLALARSQISAQSRAQTHPDVAAIDHDRILASAAKALTQPVAPITAIPTKRSPGTPHEFYSEAEEFFPDPASAAAAWLARPGAVNPDAFTAHRDASYALGLTVAALTAASVIANDPRYAARAAEHLRAWFIAPATRMTPNLQLAQCVPGPQAAEGPTAKTQASGAQKGRPEGIIETLPLAEVARSIRFLASSDALSPEEFTTLHAWFAEYAQWLNESRLGGLARDMKDHHASSWLFQSAAYADANAAGLTSDDATLNTLRRRFHTVTLRAEINALGNFPHEVSAATPYRNSLFNLDLLTLACELLTTRFENPWEYELQDGPGIRSAIAYHFPFMLNRSTWPYPADATHFKELPGRRISLLLAGRAYTRREYVDLWKSLAPLPESAVAELLRTFPISQPLLWFTQPKPARG